MAGDTPGRLAGNELSSFVSFRFPYRQLEGI